MSMPLPMPPLTCRTIRNQRAATPQNSRACWYYTGPIAGTVDNAEFEPHLRTAGLEHFVNRRRIVWTSMPLGNRQRRKLR